MKMIDEIKPHMDKLTSALRLRVKAIDARLKFKFHDATANLTQLVKELPFSKEALYALGETYFHFADPQGAMKYYQMALDLDKNYAEAINHLGYCYSYLGNHDTAIELMERLRDLTGLSNPNSFDSLGDSYFFSGDMVNAENMKRRAVVPDESGSPISWPFQTLADIYILKGEYEKAEGALKSYQKLENNEKADAFVLEKQAYIDYLERKYPEALEKIDKSLKVFDSDDINDNTAEVHWLKGLILLRLNKLPESKNECQWLEKFDSKYNISKTNFHAGLKHYLHLDALIAEKEQRIDKAEQDFKDLIGMKYSLSYWITCYHYQFFHTEYAKFLAKNKKYGEALAQVEECLRFGDKYIPALWTKARVLKNLNRVDDAEKVYGELAGLYGDSQYYRKRLKESKERKEK